MNCKRDRLQLTVRQAKFTLNNALYHTQWLMCVAKLGCLSWVILWHDAVSSGIIALHAIQLQRSHDVVCAQQTSERFFPREATHSNIDYLALSRVSFSWTGGGLCICLSNFGKFTPAQYVSTWDRPLVESCSKRNLTYFVCIWCIYTNPNVLVHTCYT